MDASHASEPLRCLFHDAKCEETRCEEVKRSPGGVTPLVGVTWGRLGHFRGVPRGSHGEKCSLSDQKGGNRHETDAKKMQFLPNLGKFDQKRVFVQVVPERFQPSELGYLVPRPTRTSVT